MKRRNNRTAHAGPPESMLAASALRLSELGDRIAGVLREGLGGPVLVIAEIAGLRDTPGRHLALTLVERAADEELARMQAWVWASNRQAVDAFESESRQRLQAGMEVLLLAEVRYHAVYGLSLTISAIDARYTLGGLARARRETVARLASEGLTERNSQLAFPAVPQRVAVVSSLQAAGYQDFVHQLSTNPGRYAFGTHLFPALMQGEGAPASIAAALRHVSAWRHSFDVVVVLRGGGSELDLACFDTYEVAAAIADCPLPVVTGIGHERDETIADLVSHTRVKTPTAAAELLVGACRLFEERVTAVGAAIADRAGETVMSTGRALEVCSAAIERGARQRLASAEAGLGSTASRFARLAQGALAHSLQGVAAARARLRVAPGRALHAGALEIQAAAGSLHQKAGRQLERADARLSRLEDRVRLLDPAGVLARGYSITYHDHRPVRRAGDLAPGTRIATRLHQGRIESTVESVEDRGHGAP